MIFFQWLFSRKSTAFDFVFLVGTLAFTLTPALLLYTDRKPFPEYEVPLFLQGGSVFQTAEIETRRTGIFGLERRTRQVGLEFSVSTEPATPYFSQDFRLIVRLDRSFIRSSEEFRALQDMSLLLGIPNAEVYPEESLALGEELQAEWVVNVSPSEGTKFASLQLSQNLQVGDTRVRLAENNFQLEIESPPDNRSWLERYWEELLKFAVSVGGLLGLIKGASSLVSWLKDKFEIRRQKKKRKALEEQIAKELSDG